MEPDTAPKPRITGTMAARIASILQFAQRHGNRHRGVVRGRGDAAEIGLLDSFVRRHARRSSQNRLRNVSMTLRHHGALI